MALNVSGGQNFFRKLHWLDTQGLYSESSNMNLEPIAEDSALNKREIEIVFC